MSRIITVDMESGNPNEEFDIWSVGTGHTMEITGAAKLHGLYGLRWYKSYNSVAYWSYAMKQFDADLEESWQRFYLRLGSDWQMSSEADLVIFCAYRDDYTASYRVIYLRLKESGGDVYLRAQTRYDGGYHDLPDSQGVPVDLSRPICVEFYHKRATGAGVPNGATTWWMDGVERGHRNDIDNYWQGAHTAMCGPYLVRAAGSIGGTVYIDDVVVDNARRIYPVLRQRRDGRHLIQRV